VNALVKADHAHMTAREQPTSGAALYRMSTDAASLCRDIVLATAQTIQGRKYVRVEGWQAIALAHGCVASSGSVVRTESGVAATGRVVQVSTGIELASAEGFVGDDEKMWSARPEYARRAMAQTRAISRACRSAFAHVVVLMNAGLSTTPAEEIEDNEPRPATIPHQGPVSNAPPQQPAPHPVQEMQRDHAATRAAAQQAAVTPPPKKQTIAEFLDGLDAELEKAPEAAAVFALMHSERVTNARSFLTNGAAQRLSDWTVRAGQKRQRLQLAEQAAAAPDAAPQVVSEEQMRALLGPLADAPIDEWPLAGEEAAAG
jgi:hypothetical protein